jgi:5-(carboxyamino)imidazole ribonucleotide mutase
MPSSKDFSLTSNNLPVAIVMGSYSDYETLKAAEVYFKKNKIRYKTQVISAHRTPKKMYQFCKTAHEKYSLIVAGAGGSAHLPGMIASLTRLPVIGVPIQTRSLNGIDSLLSIVQMPNGIPVATVAIGAAENAARLALKILSVSDKKLQLVFEQDVKLNTKLIKKMNLKLK